MAGQNQKIEILQFTVKYYNMTVSIQSVVNCLKKEVY